MSKVLGFTALVLATLAATYAVTVLALSLAPAEKMPAARPVYESKDALRHLRHPCELPYAHRGAGRWVQGCAK